MKIYYEQWMGGKIKYTVNYHDGVNMHKDGSPFYNVSTFKNKKKKNDFIKKLISEGYKDRLGIQKLIYYLRYIINH